MTLFREAYEKMWTDEYIDEKNNIWIRSKHGDKVLRKQEYGRRKFKTLREMKASDIRVSFPNLELTGKTKSEMIKTLRNNSWMV